MERRWVDAGRAGLAVLVLVGAGLAAHLGHPTVVEINLFRLINQLPSPLNAPLLGVEQLGALAAVPIIGFIAVIAGRSRLGAVLLAAGSAAWGASKVMQWLVDEKPPVLRIPQVLLHATVAKPPGLAFPTSHVAIAAALAVAASPYLRRSARRGCWLVVGLIAVARIYVGLHLPIDVIGGLALGVAIGALINLMVGVPATGVSAAQLSGVLDALGLRAVDVEVIGDPDHLRCCDADGNDYLVKTLSWDRPDHGWLSRLWRLAAYREFYSPAAPRTSSQRADHEAHLSLLAERAGVRTPSLVMAEDVGPDTSVIVRRWIDATPFCELSSVQITDAVLRDAWCQLAAAHRAGIIHRRVHPRHLLVDATGRVWLVGWGAASADTDRSARNADLAEMAVILASRAGVDRAVEAATGALGRTSLGDVLSHLQPLALGPAARDLSARDPVLLAALRARVAAVEGSDVPPPVSPARVAIRNLVPLAGLGLAVYILLPRLARSSTTWATLGHARWPWLLAVAGGGALTYAMAAGALMAAAGRRLPYGRTFAVQLAAASTNRVVPAGLGGAATNLRYLEMTGLNRSDATTAIALTAVGGFTVHFVATIVAVTLLRSRAVALHVPDLDNTWLPLLILGVACAIIGWVVWARRLHDPIVRWVRATSCSVGAAVTNPGRMAVLIAASAGISVGYILALAAALAAYGARPGLGTVAGVYLASSAIAAVAPTPGGVGPFEAAAVAGLGTLGVGAAPAVAAVITYRLITYWLPVAPGGVALHLLRRHGTL